MEPMYATLGREVPDGPEWIFEPKYDGVRILAHATRDGIRLVTRNGKDKTEQFPEIVRALRALSGQGGRPLVLDGEIVALRDGRPARFQALQDRVHLRDRDAVHAAAASDPGALVAFDLLAEDGEWLLDSPWEERRRRLEGRVGVASPEGILLSDVLPGNGLRSLDEARRKGWEGVIAKRSGARYHPGRRSRDWLKLKIEFRQELVVGGWTDPQRSRPYLGSLLVGYYEGDELVFAGGVGTGFTRRSLRDTLERLRPLERPTPPFRDPPRPRTTAHWVHPELVVELKFAEWTADGKLRQPVVLGFRDDKPAREVTREETSLQADRS